MFLIEIYTEECAVEKLNVFIDAHQYERDSIR